MSGIARRTAFGGRPNLGRHATQVGSRLDLSWVALRPRLGTPRAGPESGIKCGTALRMAGLFLLSWLLQGLCPFRLPSWPPPLGFLAPAGEQPTPLDCRQQIERSLLVAVGLLKKSYDALGHRRRDAALPGRSPGSTTESFPPEHALRRIREVHVFDTMAAQRAASAEPSRVNEQTLPADDRDVEVDQVAVTRRTPVHAVSRVTRAAR